MKIDIRTRKMISFICLGVCLVLTLIGIFALPEDVVIQLALFGEEEVNTLTKPMAILTTTALGVGLSLLGAFYEHEKKDALAYMAGAIVMVAAQALILICNL